MSLTTLDIKEPGLNILPPGVERHVVNAGGLTGLQIFPDDEIEIINDEGNQICEIICFDKDGKSELAILNLKENSNKSFIKEILKTYVVENPYIIGLNTLYNANLKKYFE